VLMSKDDPELVEAAKIISVKLENSIPEEM
jgi:hypothetical protein